MSLLTREQVKAAYDKAVSWGMPSFTPSEISQLCQAWLDQNSTDPQGVPSDGSSIARAVATHLQQYGSYPAKIPYGGPETFLFAQSDKQEYVWMWIGDDNTPARIHKQTDPDFEWQPEHLKIPKDSHE